MIKQLLFYHLITMFVFLMNIFGKRSDLPFFTQEQSRVVSFTHEQTIICRQLFAGHGQGHFE